uniref:Uncharacterized protein n=1 Tax=Arundo donax TaxID=35708 RepID=A0A0A9SBF2_ARUDO
MLKSTKTCSVWLKT